MGTVAMVTRSRPIYNCSYNLLSMTYQNCGVVVVLKVLLFLTLNKTVHVYSCRNSVLYITCTW